MTDAAKETVFQLLREYGFATLVACFLGYVGRQDVILPMVESHRAFLKDIAETQREISQAVAEQTRLLYALQPKAAGTYSSVNVPDDTPKN